MAKHVSSSTYRWAHIGVIIFHVIVAVVVYQATRVDKMWGYDSSNVIRVTAVVLGVVSLLGLVPILKHDEVEIN